MLYFLGKYLFAAGIGTTIGLLARALSEEGSIYIGKPNPNQYNKYQKKIKKNRQTKFDESDLKSGWFK